MPVNYTRPTHAQIDAADGLVIETLIDALIGATELYDPADTALTTALPWWAWPCYWRHKHHFEMFEGPRPWPAFHCLLEAVCREAYADLQAQAPGWVVPAYDTTKTPDQNARALLRAALDAD